VKRDFLSPEKELRESFGKEYDECKIKLGNLALLEKPMNIVARNDFFNEKKRYTEIRSSI